MFRSFCRLTAVCVFLTVLSVPLFAAGESRASRAALRKSNTATSRFTPLKLSLPPEEAKKQLAELAAEIRSGYRPLTEKELQQSRKLLAEAAANLLRRLPADGKEDWKDTLKLDALSATLAKDTPDTTVLEEVQNALYSDKEGIRWTLFDGLRAALRRYNHLAKMLKDGTYGKQLENVLGNLSQYVDKYSGKSEALYADALSDVCGWLDDVSIAEPRTAKLAALTRAALSGVNVKVQISEEFVRSGFERRFTEALNIDENIDGTHIVGTGQIDAQTAAELLPSGNSAQVKILVSAAMESDTDGFHKPVTLKNHTTGTITGGKIVEFSADGFTTKPAKAQADLTSQISNVRVDGCCIVKLIAKGQVEERKADAELKAEKRAADRLKKRIDNEADSRFAELNERYQNIREPLVKAGLFPDVWQLSGNTSEINWAIQAATANQPSAPQPAPELKEHYGLAVQVHQSAINNLAATFLAGRFIDEEKSAERLEKYFKNKPKFLERKSDVSPAKVSFGRKAPIDVTFADNRIKAVVRLEDIEVLNSADKSYTITVIYKAGVSKKDGKDIVVLEQESAEAFPSSYKSGSRLSAVQTVIRSYLLKRLEVLPKKFESKPLELGGEWKGKGTLTAAFLSAESGWLTLAWNWEK